MRGIAVGELRLTGGLGIGKITKFSMREYPGEHARAELVGIAEMQGSGAAELFGSIKNCSVELSAEGYGEGKANVSGYIHDLRAGDHPDRIGVGNDGGVSPSAG